MSDIVIKGLTQNNLKNVSLTIPKGKLVVFTGVSGSGKSSIVFDTIAAESQRQINETYSAFIRSRLPKYKKPRAEKIENLTASVIVDQSPLGGNARSTVGTISGLYSGLRLLYSRIGEPCVGTASFFSFNDPNGMCKRCAGMGKVATLNVEHILDRDKSWQEGCVRDTLFKPGSWYWQQYTDSGLFNPDIPLRELPAAQYHALLYGTADGSSKIEGLHHQYNRLYLNRDISSKSKHTQEKAAELIHEEECPDCQGKRLNQAALGCRIKGYSIDQLCEMEFSDLKHVLLDITDPRAETIVQSLTESLERMIAIGLPYLHLNRESSSMSGGEAQRLKLVRYMGSSLTGMTYIFDEPSTGMHPRDVYRMNQLLGSLRDKGNTVLVVEHDKDVIAIADEVIDIGPQAGKLGGRVVFQGSYEKLLCADTLTARGLKQCYPLKSNPRKAKGMLPVRNANLHNLKNVSVDIPLGIMTVVTGVAGSGKSSLISSVFAKEYEDLVIKVDQGPITATNRSTPASYLGFFDQIRKLFTAANHVDMGMFSFNSKGGCPVCEGKGVVVTELAFMDPVVTVCEACEGKRYSEESLSYRYHEKNMIEVLSMTVSEALEFFEDKKIRKYLKTMMDVGLSYLTLGQPLSTLSGGERQRIKLARHMDKKGGIYILDEPTTGLHMSDIEKLVQLFEYMVSLGNTVIIVEHNMDVMKQADWIIDIGPDGGKNGGQVVFEGTPKELYTSAQTITAKCLRKS